MKLCKTENEFIEAVAPAAQSACTKLGTFLPSVLIAQAAQETGYCIPSYADNSQLALLIEKNNLLGMKSALLSDSWADKTLWNGVSLTKKTPEYYNGKKVTITDNFRVYDSVEQCFMDYILFLLYASNNGRGGTPKYGKGVTDIKDYAKLITTVSERGYATDPKYPCSVQNIINKHNLTKYDSVEKKDGESVSRIIKLADREIIDVTARNKSQVPARRTQSIKWIVCHYLGVANANNENLYGGGYGGHYYVSTTGKLYKAADPKTAVVWQCGGKKQGESKDYFGVAPHRYYKQCTNYNSLGIECGVNYDTDWYFSEAAQESYVYLVSKLMDEYGIDYDHVIRHFDVTGKTCPAPWVKKPHNTSWTWSQFKANLKQYRTNGTITIPDGSEPYTPDTPTPNYLKKGDKGDAVKTMQNMLIKCGYDLGKYGADGDFGNATLEAVKKFQSDHSLTVDGYYGTKSKAKLEELYKAKQEAEEANSTVFEGVDYSPVYNYSYYRQKYEDLQKAFGTDKAKYFQHFCKYGMKEGRRAASAFDVHAYKNRYEDLQKAYGDYLPNYYRHYCKYGKKEGRKAT